MLPFTRNIFSSTFTWYYLFSMQFYLFSMWINSYDVTLKMNPLQQQFYVVLFIQYEVLRVFSLWINSYDVTIHMKPLQQCFHMAKRYLSLWMNSDHSNGTFSAVLSSRCRVLLFQYVVLTFNRVDEILWCYHSNETFSAVLSHSTIYLVTMQF